MFMMFSKGITRNGSQILIVEQECDTNQSIKHLANHHLHEATFQTLINDKFLAILAQFINLKPQNSKIL